MDHKKNQQGQEDSPHPDPALVSKTNDAADASVSRREFLGFAAASIFLAGANQQASRTELRNGIPPFQAPRT